MDSASASTETPDRMAVLDDISEAARYGNLGLFIGAGFSKAVLNTPDREVALSWGDLLERAAKQLGVDYAALSKEGLDYPAIASRICKACSDNDAQDYQVAALRLKRAIANLTALHPTPQSREQFGGYLRRADPAWIVTTNYDLVIESLLTGLAESLGPKDVLSSPKGIIPVFHLHGSRALPEGLIATQEDYVSLFRPSEYRQVKLALTIKESMTVLLGYGLGDVNVLTALDWSRNVFQHSKTDYPQGIIQVLRVDQPRHEPYLDRNGVLILETGEISEFFEEFLAHHHELVREDNDYRAALADLAASIREPDDATIRDFIDNPASRKSILTLLSLNSHHLLPSFVTFFERCIDETWTRAEPDGAFHGYDQNLTLILDILTAFPYERFPPALLQTAAAALERVGYYVGSERGKSWRAGQTWTKRKHELSESMRSDLHMFADQYDCPALRRLLSQ